MERLPSPAPVPWVLALVVLLASASAARAQGPQRPGPGATDAPGSRFLEKPAIAEKAQRIHKKITDTGFYPTIRGLAAGTGIGPGLTFWKPRPFGGPVGLLGTVGWNPRVLLLEARVGRIPSRPGKIPDRRFSLEALTTHAPEGPNHRWFAFAEARRAAIKDNRLYFTAGPKGDFQPADIGSAVRLIDESPDSATVHFDVLDIDADLVGGYHFFPGLAASVRLGYVSAETLFEEPEEETPELPPIPGVNETEDFTRWRVDFILDRRDVRTRARQGFLIHAGWWRMNQRGEDFYGFKRLRFDSRAFLSTPDRRHTLALRFLGARDTPTTGRGVPFYFQQTLGGNHTLRSYPIFRFRGTRILAFSAEYRLALLRFLELAAFYDGGDVSGSVEALGSQGYRESLGLSARWVSEKDVIFRVFAAHGSEGWRLSGSGAFPF